MNINIILQSVRRFQKNENMKPMGLTSTPFLSYHEIKTEGIDIFEDAFGFYQQFSDMIRLLKQLKPVPDNRLTNRLIGKIRKCY